MKENWRINAQNETEKYLKQGLLDRAVTRDLDWGIDIPIDGFEDKKMYVWIDAVLGYLTNTMRLSEEKGFSWEDFWKNGHNNSISMCHGKDNIVFHSIIFPGLLLSMDDGMALPDTIVSSEYLNFNNEKASKSKGNAISAGEIVEKYNVDTARFHLINNGPEKKDTNFTPEDFVNTHNSDIVNKFGNLINRTLKFKGIENINMAEKFKGCYLKIKRENARKLPKDTYFIADLLGLEVYTDEGLFLGKVDDIFNAGANDVYVVKDELGKQVLLPAIKEVIKNVDIENKLITVHLMEGLI